MVFWFVFFHVSKFYLNIFIKMRGKNNIILWQKYIICSFFWQNRQNATASLRSVTAEKKEVFFPKNAHLPNLFFSDVFSWSKSFFFFFWCCRPVNFLSFLFFLFFLDVYVYLLCHFQRLLWKYTFGEFETTLLRKNVFMKFKL